jgi:CRISPR-associated protein Cas1
MAWRSVVITQPAHLRLEQRALVVKQDAGEVRVPLEDISVLVIDQPQVTLSAQLLSACATRQIAVITVGDNHHPNGVLLPHLPHSRALQVMRKQLDMSQPRRKRLWQSIVQRKINNQAEVLQRYGLEAANLLHQMARDVKSGDSGNLEAHAAQAYFRALFGLGFSRSQERLHNAALNYGYSVIRSALARNLVAYGFITAFGLHHKNEQNAFNLADDLIEPFRPILDAYVLGKLPPCDDERELNREDKAHLVSVLHHDVAMWQADALSGHSSLLAACEAIVISLVQRLDDEATHLHMPSLAAKNRQDHDEDD